MQWMRVWAFEDASASAEAFGNGVGRFFGGQAVFHPGHQEADAFALDGNVYRSILQDQRSGSRQLGLVQKQNVAGHFVVFGLVRQIIRRRKFFLHPGDHFFQTPAGRVNDWQKPGVRPVTR